MYNRKYYNTYNKIYFVVATCILFAVVLFNLFNLQIVRGSEYYFASKNVVPDEAIVRASRGLIFDRNGVKLVDNELKYNLYIIRNTARPTYKELLDKTLENLSSLFNENAVTKFQNSYEKYGNPEVSHVKLYSKIDYNPYIFQIEANPSKFPLVSIEKTNVRRYLYPELTSHIIGYTSEISAEDYQTGKFDFGDEIGKFGLEKGYDDVLRGRNGKERIDYYINENKKVVSTVAEKSNGQDIYLTIDINYQKKLYELTASALKSEQLKEAVSSATVLQDVNSGEVLAMISYPTFDSNLFAGGINTSDYNAYLNNPGKPLSNKAMQYSQSPGSIIKPLTAVTALDKGAINKSTTYVTGGTFEYGGVTFQDVERKNFGTINVVQAICVSSNIFHMKAALDLDKVTSGKAPETIADSFTKIGLDRQSNLKLGSESIGYFPIPADKREKKQVWLPGYLLNASIGQGEVRMTPLGAANMASVIANDGTIYQQTIVKTSDTPSQKQSLEISKTHFDTVKEGMSCAAKKDNPVTAYDPAKYIDVSVKTGTAETGQVKDGKSVIHGWEISFGPSEKPEIAMAIFVENGQHGYKSGAISREFYKYWSLQNTK